MLAKYTGYMVPAQLSETLARVGTIFTQTRVLEEDPENAEAEFLVGEAYVYLDNLEKAEEHLQKAMELDPEDEEEVGSKAELTLLISQIPDDSEGVVAGKIAQWRGKYPDHPRKLAAVFYEGVAWYNAGEYEKARERFLGFKKRKGTAEQKSEYFHSAMYLLESCEAILAAE
jgi:tetratricopeptide (TPR) repeat protein